MAARTRSGLGALLADITRKPVAKAGLDKAPETPPRVSPRDNARAMAEGLVNAVYAMPGALEAIRDEVCGLKLLEHPEQHRVLLIAQSVREVCRRFGLPVPKGCDWDCVVRLLYPHGAKGDWRAEANLLAHERGLNPRYRWVREEESLPGADEEWLAQVLLAAMRGDGSALVGFVERVVEDHATLERLVAA